MRKADRPTGSDEREYHLETRPGDLASNCLLVGSPERAEMIAGEYFYDCKKVGDHRGLKSFTGKVAHGVPVSVVTTGMGSASTAIVLPEAVRCGVRRMIRVGSCGTLWEEANVGDSAICTAAVRLDGASDSWAPVEFPAVADYGVVNALVSTAELLGFPHHVGVGATTADFNEGQARPGIDGSVPKHMLDRHEALGRCNVLFYSMEEATIFVWCATHQRDERGERRKLWCGAIDAIFANRKTNKFAVKGEQQATEIAIGALVKLHNHSLLK